MEVQQILEMLIELKADRKAYQEKADAGQAEIIAAIEKKTYTWIAKIKDARKKTTTCQEVTRANPEKIKPNSEEKETAMEQHEIPNEEVAVQSQKTCRSETAASQEDTETKPDPGTMQSVEEHLEIPKEDAIVMPVGEPRKRV
jgi:hypothetical protein